jgi:hypothetical protein
MKRLFLIAAAGAVALSAPATAQLGQREVIISPPEPAVAFPSPAQIPLPPNGCVWAGRSFSDGAQFCVATKLIESCTGGRWTMTPSEACTSSPLDTK